MLTNDNMEAIQTNTPLYAKNNATHANTAPTRPITIPSMTNGHL